MRLCDLFEAQYAPRRRLSPKTLHVYRVTLRHFDKFLGRRATLDDLREDQVARFVAEREHATSTATAGRDLTQLCCLWRYACRQKLGGRGLKWPEFKPMRGAERAPIAYLAEEISAILARCRTLAGTMAGISRGDWFASIVLAMYQSGERITATRSVEWRDVDFASRTIVFRGETRKGRKRDIQRKISAELAAMLAARRGRARELVWPWPKSLCMLWDDFERICIESGVTYRGFHAIRRASGSYVCATLGIEAAMKHLDHSSIQVTRRYLDPRIVKEDDSACDVLPPVT